MYYQVENIVYCYRVHSFSKFCTLLFHTVLVCGILLSAVCNSQWVLANASNAVAAEVEYVPVVGEMVALYNHWVLFGTTTILQHVDGTPQLI